MVVVVSPDVSSTAKEEQQKKIKMLINKYPCLVFVFLDGALPLSSKTETTSMDCISREINKNYMGNMQKILPWSNILDPF